MAVSLRFHTPLVTTHPVNLRFNASAAPVGESVLELSTTIAAPTMEASLARVRALTLAGTIAAPTMVAALAYDNAVFRGPNGGARSGWQVAQSLHVLTEDGMEQGLPLAAHKAQPWQEAQALSAASRSVLQSGIPRSSRHASGWNDAVRIGIDVGQGFTDLVRLRNTHVARWQLGVHVGIDRSTDWQQRIRRHRAPLTASWSQARHLGIDRITLSGVAKPLRQQRKTTWQEARKPPPGRYVLPPMPVVPTGCYTPPAGGNVNLRFTGEFIRTTELRFSCSHGPAATIVIPARSVYMVLNEVHLVRVDGAIELPHFSLSLSIDMDSWTWSFTASLPASTLPLLMPDGPGAPVILEAEINGAFYRLQVEDIKRDRVFGKSSISVSGVGQSAILSDPYSPILTFGNDDERTAQQLMNDALMTNGVSLGWAVDWRIDDWLVPAGAWRHQGTYMSAVNAIAAAAGAFIQPDPVAQTLRVRARYPVLPWAWAGATPDIEIPSDVIVKEAIAFRERPGYNFVVVSGTTAGGTLGRVKRAGTAGDVIATMVSDALITAPAAARQRGGRVLADTGRQALYSLGLPVLPETGIIDPGTLIRYVDAGVPTVGLVKGVGVNTTSSDNGKVIVRQTIEVETHA